MCGIAAAYAYSSRRPAIDERQVTILRDRMVCRGPDGHGLWSSPDHRTVLGHRRLSIIDLSERGAQPMLSKGGAIAISFNGEIYNYRELRRELEELGHEFRSDADTEVILHLYEEHGRSMLPMLRGMFAFALWDSEKQGLLLARDPFGIKPLYVADDGECVWAASEVKALLQQPTIDSSANPAGHVGFYLWGHVPEPFTLYRGIRSLPAGSWMWFSRDQRLQAGQYANLTEMLSLAERSTTPPSEGEVGERLREALLDSIRSHLVADVDVGVFLSAGIDSTTLAGLAAEIRGRLKTVTLGFEEYRGTEQDETPLAEAVARQYGTDHTTVWITRRDFEADAAGLLDRMDQPSIDGINTYFVAKAAASTGLKVAISGLGGDELFAGYGGFREIPRLVSVVRRLPAGPSLGKAIRALTAPVVRRITSPKYAAILEYGGSFAEAYLLRRGLFLPWELSRIFDTDFLISGLESLHTVDELSRTVEGLALDRFKVSALEASWYMRNQLLRDTDWASMSHSLEVRVPLVDWTLWRAVTELIACDNQLNKRDMAGAVRPALPRRIIYRTKTGFTTPAREWLLHHQRSRRYAERGLRGWAHFVHEAAA